MRVDFIVMIVMAVVLAFMSVKGATEQRGAIAAKSGFMSSPPGFSPASFRTPASPASLSVPDAARKTIILYSPGTRWPQFVEDCAEKDYAPPPAIMALERARNTHVYYLCPRSTDAGVPGAYIFSRAREIKAAIDVFLQRGVEPRNIFLAGHSAGAWSSMMLMGDVGRKFNAVIGFGPACCYPRDVADRYPYSYWRQVVRPYQTTVMTAARRFEALLFAYPDDPFNRPDDLAFLTDAYPRGVRLVSQSCGEGHMTPLRDCRVDETAGIIRRYIAERKALFQG